MDKRTIGYWVTTGLFCLSMGAGGFLNLIHAEPQKEIFVELGYPDYFMTILGVAKILGVVALLLPNTPLLKEWAYAGFTFDLLGASASHAFAQDPIAEMIVPLAVLGVAVGSYRLRPSSRRLALADQRGS